MNAKTTKPLGPSDADILSRALLSGAFELAATFARLHPETLLSHDSAGRHNSLNLLNSGHSSGLSPKGRSDLMDLFFSLGADPFAIQTDPQSGKSLTMPQMLSHLWNMAGNSRHESYSLAEDSWVRAATSICRNDPELAMKGLLFRVLFGDFKSDLAAGVPELAALCDPCDPMLPETLSRASHLIESSVETVRANGRINLNSHAFSDLLSDRLRATLSISEELRIERLTPPSPPSSRPPPKAV